MGTSGSSSNSMDVSPCKSSSSLHLDHLDYLCKVKHNEIYHKMTYSTNHVYLHRPNAFGFWQTRLHLCYETLKRVSNFSELA